MHDGGDQPAARIRSARLRHLNRHRRRDGAEMVVFFDATNFDRAGPRPAVPFTSPQGNAGVVEVEHDGATSTGLRGIRHLHRLAEQDEAGLVDKEDPATSNRHHSSIAREQESIVLRRCAEHALVSGDLMRRQSFVPQTGLPVDERSPRVSPGVDKADLPRST